jgi:hypothetical protein
MAKLRFLFLIFLIFVFLAGIYVILNSKKENLENIDDKDCPNLLVQKGNVLMLYNTNQPTSDSNPIPFFNLDEYIYYLEIQRKRGKSCPVLYLNQETNAQGKDVYRMRPSPFDLQGGLPQITNLNQYLNKEIPIEVTDATHDNPPYNANNYAGFDPYGHHVGVYTNIDKIHDSTKSTVISDNPMDSNWAGVGYTQQMVDSGKYDENAVTKPILFTPKAAFHPIGNDMPPPKDII